MKKKYFLKKQKFIKRMIRKSIKENDELYYYGWTKELQGLKATYMNNKARKKFLLKFFTEEELNNIWNIYL